MQTHALVALVSLLALLTYFGFSVVVARAHHRTGIHAPAMSGDPQLERAVRVHYNTLEWLPIFLVSMWLFALYWNDRAAAGLGVVWIIGRIIYAMGYLSDPAKRGAGFGIQALATLLLLLGALGRIVYVLTVVGA